MATDGHAVADAGFVRGACPSLAAPMMTGDGLLVRLRPTTPGLAIGQLRDLARAALHHGNGLMEITARGNIQLRGLSSETMPNLARAIDLAGIVPESGLTIETPPLSGRDKTEIANSRTMAALLRQALPVGLHLAPKLTIIVDGRGLFDLDALSADIRLVATAPGQWNIYAGATGAQSRLVSGACTDEQAVAATVDLLLKLQVMGPRARGRDLPVAPSEVKPVPLHAPRSPLGIHAISPNDAMLGLTPCHGQIPAEKLIALLDIVEGSGADEIRTAPDHVILLLGISRDRLEKVRAAAEELGFDADTNGPFHQIASCSGAGACASAAYRTKEFAIELVQWAPGLFDGSMAVHLSGCPKGCAHPAPAAITIVGLPAGYGIIVEGAASAMPITIVDKIGLKSAVQRLVALVSDSHAANESVKACLKRLGGATIAAVLRQE